MVQLILGWPWFYQLGLIAVIALTPLYFFAVNHHLAQRAVAHEADWVESPIVTQYRVLERRRTIRAGAGYDDVFEMRLLRDGRELATVSVVRLYEGSFWRVGKWDDLYITPTTKAPLLQTIRSERFRELLSRATEVLCIGLASSKGNDRSGGEQLSIHRAARLCDILRGTGNFSHVTLREVPFGQALGPEPTDPLQEQAQRAAVIIGVHRADRTISDQVLYDELLRRVRLNTVDLNNYSRVAQLRAVD